ncbi:MAG: MarR family transcriptional regulator [Acidobacteriota bacterium]
MTTDLLDSLLDDWRRERADLDPAAMAIVGRIIVLGEHFKKSVSEALAVHGLGYTDFDVLATLRRSGEPFQLRPAELLRAVLIQSGSLTACLDRLERSGWVARVATPGDRRGRSVQLTDAGRELIDRLIGVRFAEAADRIASLDSADQETLARLLRTLLIAQHETEVAS